MKALIQRVLESSITVRGNVVGHIGRGLLLFLGIEKGDGQADIDYLTRKILNLRIFDDERGRMNLAIGQVKGSVLVVSQFTLSADWRKGNRPSFDRVESQERAEQLYDTFVQRLRETGIPLSTGIFGASMQVRLINDGPVTLVLDSQRQVLL